MSFPSGTDVFIVSDLHLGEGWLPAQQRYARLETFFYDDDFRRFCHAIIRHQQKQSSPVTLVLNGDIFDFLAIVRVPKPMAQRTSGLRVTRSERKFGLDTTEEKAVWKIERILKGHRKWVIALCEIMAAGNRVVFIRGNHDAELHWEGVQNKIRDVIFQAAEEGGLVNRGESLQGQLEFRQWFLYEKNRYFIEHGNQYEESNAFRHVMNPVLPPEYHPQRKVTLDYPMGSLFVRYLYNKMKLLDPFATHFVTLEQYIRITSNHNLMDLLRTGILHFPFFFRAIREARVFELQGMSPVAEENEKRLSQLAKTTGVGDKIFEIQKLMSRPAGGTKYTILKEMLRPVARGVLTFSAIAMLSLLGWFFVFAAIQHTGWFAEGLLAKASLLAILAVVTVVGLFITISFIRRALHTKRDPVVQRCYECAEQIASILDVPNVVMGHSHAADNRAFRRRSGAYANSGTWIPQPGPWDSVRPKARQFTFVRITGDVMKLLRWNDPQNVWEPVTLLEEYHPSPLERLLAESEHLDRPHSSPGAEDV